MPSDLQQRRQFFAEEIQVAANLRTPALVDALATVPRERFLGPGPWTFRGESDFRGGPRRTPDADPKHVYHNIAIAIDESRQLFNGAPVIIASCIDALGLRGGARVLHVGPGLGYFTALMAHAVGPDGRVVAIEVDEALANDARARLAMWPTVDVWQGDGTDLRGESFDVILINAGTTHPHAAWLAALGAGGRLVVPLTCTFPQMGPIGKGFIVAFSDNGAPGELEARVLTMVAIYSAVGIRDAGLNERLGKAFGRSPFPAIKRLRRDVHEESASCWLHSETFCLASA